MPKKDWGGRDCSQSGGYLTTAVPTRATVYLLPTFSSANSLAIHTTQSTRPPPSVRLPGGKIPPGLKRLSHPPLWTPTTATSLFPTRKRSRRSWEVARRTESFVDDAA